MRTLIFIVAGLAAAGILMATVSPALRKTGLLGFGLVWLILTGWNFATGLSHGHGVAVELPIHVAIFGVPFAAAFWLAHR